jgi:hypothetical protein
MNRTELKTSLDKLGVPHSRYMLDGGFAILKPIIENKHEKWICNEYDEKGNHFQQYFDTEEDICKHVYKRFYQEYVIIKEIRDGIRQPVCKQHVRKTTKNGDIIVFQDGVPKWKNSIEICPDNPVYLNGNPVLFNEKKDIFDESLTNYF